MTPVAPDIQAEAALLTRSSLDDLRDLIWLVQPGSPSVDDPWSIDALTTARDAARLANDTERQRILQAEIDRIG